MWLAVIKALLSLVIVVMKSRNDEELKQIGADRVIKETLTEIALRSGIAKKVSDASKLWTDADVDERLRKFDREQ